MFPVSTITNRFISQLLKLIKMWQVYANNETNVQIVYIMHVWTFQSSIF